MLLTAASCIGKHCSCFCSAPEMYWLVPGAIKAALFSSTTQRHLSCKPHLQGVYMVHAGIYLVSNNPENFQVIKQNMKIKLWNRKKCLTQTIKWLISWKLASWYLLEDYNFWRGYIRANVSRNSKIFFLIMCSLGDKWPKMWLLGFSSLWYWLEPNKSF